MDIKIFSCFHKEFKIPNSNVIYPIHVGKSISDMELNMVNDNTGENISNKNKNYCELTAIYWAWKNVNCDVIGLTHYRRYFDLEESYYEVITEEENIINSDIFKSYKEKIENIMLSTYDIIMPKPKTFGTSVKNQYIACHKKEDLDVLESIIKKKYPEYIASYDYIMKKQNKLSPYNMFIMKKKEFNKYCEWLFDILFEVEKKIKISENTYQARVFGFMSERLLNVYVYHNKLNVKYTTVIFIGDKKKYNNYVIENLRNLKNEMKFKLLKG